MKASTILTLIDNYQCQGFNGCTIVTDARREYSFSFDSPNKVRVDPFDMLVKGTPMGYSNGHQIVIDSTKIESITFYKEENE